MRCEGEGGTAYGRVVDIDQGTALLIVRVALFDTVKIHWSRRYLARYSLQQIKWWSRRQETPCSNGTGGGQGGVWRTGEGWRSGPAFVVCRGAASTSTVLVWYYREDTSSTEQCDICYQRTYHPSTVIACVSLLKATDFTVTGMLLNALWGQ